MGYFSNGSEGCDYESHYCERCRHEKPDKGGCAVWLAHLIHNYDECNNEDSILHMLRSSSMMRPLKSRSRHPQKKYRQ